MATPKSKRRRKYIILGAIVLVIAGLSAAAMMRRREPAIKVQTEKVDRRNVTETVVANGRIQPVLQVKISAEVSGEIIELPVKEGQAIKKGELLVKIKPDLYTAQRRSAEASYLSALSGKTLSEANLRKAELEYKRNEDMFRAKLISDSVFLEFRTGFDIAKAQLESATHQVDVARAALARAEEELAKTTIYSPLTGTVSKLNSELGERVVGTAMMSGTEIMTVADLNAMEARVDIGEIDIPLIAFKQNAKLEVDAFRDRKFKGIVTEIANSSKTGLAGSGGGGQSQDATKFEVRIRIEDKEHFRPGMTVTAEIETRSRSNVLTVPVQSVTTRPPKPPPTASGPSNVLASASTNVTPAATDTTQSASLAHASTATATNASTTNLAATATVCSTNGSSTNVAAADSKDKKDGKKPGEAPKPIEVVFVVDGDHVKMVPVKRGIGDDTYMEIEEGLTEGQEVVSGGYKAISKDLEDGKKITRGGPETKETGKDQPDRT
jgi:HlyD family secretion protein